MYSLYKLIGKTISKLLFIWHVKNIQLLQGIVVQCVTVPLLKS